MESLPLKLCENTFNARFRRVYYTKFMFLRLNVYKLNYPKLKDKSLFTLTCSKKSHKKKRHVTNATLPHIDGSSVSSSQFFSPSHVRDHGTQPPPAQEKASSEQLFPIY